MAAVFACIYSEIMARILKTPVTTFIIGAIIPLVPGGNMYNAMFQYVQGNINQSLSIAFKTLAIAGSIAIGIFFASSIFKTSAFFNRKILKNR
jgi:uncharacterized membrane protein YjjB (DUF3815 family)